MTNDTEAKKVIERNISKMLLCFKKKVYLTNKKMKEYNELDIPYKTEEKEVTVKGLHYVKVRGYLFRLVIYETQTRSVVYKKYFIKEKDIDEVLNLTNECSLPVDDSLDKKCIYPICILIDINKLSKDLK